MTNASLLDELGKSPVNPFPRNVRLSRGVKGGKGFTSELKPYPFIYPVSTREKISPENEVGSPAGWLVGCLEKIKRKISCNYISDIYIHTNKPPYSSLFNYIPYKNIFFFTLPCQTRKTLSP